MTVSMNPVPSFGQLTLEQATSVIYDQVIPACEAKGVMLSEYGNHAARGSLSTVAQYDQLKGQQRLFSVDRVQKAFNSVDLVISPCTQYKSGSYGLKHVLERSHSAKGQHQYFANGDLIAAMLIKGYNARFAKRGEALGVNCEFKVKSIK